MTADAADAVIHPAWRAWVAENLARGAAVQSVIDALAEEGTPRDLAEGHVRAIAESPAMGVARNLWRRTQALQLMARLRHEHRRWQPGTGTPVVRRSLPRAEEFLASYWGPGVPVVFTDLVPRWPGFTRWSPRDFTERFGDVVVKACVGRTRIADPDAEWTEVERELPMRELVQLIESGGSSNDVYVIAKNAILRRPELRPLLAEIALPPEYFGSTLDPSRMTLWFGPAGTHTPLHHDGDNAMFCQVVGRKRIRLAPPESVALLDRSRGVYCTWDPKTEAELENGPERLVEVMLEPGEALFIPAGWWHQVDALDLSMSVSILQFAWPNDFGWYKPGSILRGTLKPPSPG